MSGRHKIKDNQRLHLTECGKDTLGTAVLTWTAYWKDTTCVMCLDKRPLDTPPTVANLEEAPVHSSKWNALNIIKDRITPTLNSSDDRLTSLKKSLDQLEDTIEKETVLNDTLRTHLTSLNCAIKDQEHLEGQAESDTDMANAAKPHDEHSG